MHGIERTRKLEGNPGPDDGVSRIQVRYSDGRVVNFLPDARRDNFSEDDIHELKEVFDKASAAAEWSEVGNLGNL